MNPRYPNVRILLTLAILPFAIGCTGRGLRIESIDPRIGNMGEILTIRGTGFQHERGDNRVSISGSSPTASSYIEWSDTRIAVRVPDFGESGLVYVHVGGKRSNAALFTNRASVPLPISSNEEGIGPRASNLDQSSAMIGGAVTISGKNFGAARENGEVLFSWDAETPPSAPAAVRAPDWVAVSDHEFGYELWSDREIRVRVPDGASSGNLVVKTSRGISDPLFLELMDKPGTKIFKEKRTYAFNYSVEVQVSRVSGPNTLYLWVPQPVSSPSQRNRQLVSRSLDPFVENHRGTSLFQLKDLEAGSSTRISLAYIVDTYTVETQIKPSLVKRGIPGPVRSAYTLSNPLIPADDKEITKLAEKLVGKERNPYLQARKLYDWLVLSAGIGTEPFDGGPLEIPVAKKADPYSASLLFCALARSLGIPSLPVSGFVVDRNRASFRHWWAEFWLDGFGWIPVDPAFGAGAVPSGLTLRADKSDYYFGNMDNQRIIFSRGFADLSPMDPRGRIVARPKVWALQNLWEESVGALDSYSSLWNDITVSGIY